MKRRSSASNKFIDFPIEFNQENYDSFESVEEKNNYLISNLNNFYSHYNETSPLILSENSVPKFKSFFEILSSSLSSYHSWHSNICKFLITFKPYYSEIPHPEEYLYVSYHIFFQYAKQPEPYFNETLSILFKEKQFCKAFLSQSKLQELLEINMPDSENFSAVLSIINTDSFLQSIMNMDNHEKYIIEIFNYVQFHEKPRKNKYLITFFHFILNIMIRIFPYNSDIFSNVLFDTGILEFINSILIQTQNSETIWEIYHPLLQCSINIHDIPYDPKMFLELIKLYSNDEISSEIRIQILSKINDETAIFNSAYCINQIYFPIYLLVTPDCVSDLNLFKIFITIIEKCMVWSKLVVDRPIIALIELLAPPLKSNIDYDSIFEWFFKISNDHEITALFFDDDVFFNKLFITPKKSEANRYFEFPHFYSLFQHIFSAKKYNHHSYELINCIFGFMRYYKNEKVVNQFPFNKLLYDNFGVDILNYCMENILDDNVSLILQNFPLDFFSTVSFSKLFYAGDTFSIILRHLSNDDFPDNKTQQYLYEILFFMQIIVCNTNDHFFDEWVINLDKESPLFKILNEAVISSFVLNNNVIFLPSLVPFIDNVEINSPYNFYLLGRYAVPVYQKIGVSLEKIPNIEKIISYYISYDIFEKISSLDIIKENPKLLGNSALNEDIQCYEFLLGAPSGYITFNSPCNYLMFNIKFDAFSFSKFPFLSFSKEKLYLDGNIIFCGKSKLKEIQHGNWYIIRISKTRIMNWTEIYIDNEKVFSFHKAFNFEMIGDNKYQPTTSYFVAQNIFVSQQAPDQLIINDYGLHSPKLTQPLLHGGVVAAPTFSVSNLLKTNFSFIHVFDKFDEFTGKFLKNSELFQDLENDFKQYFLFLTDIKNFLSDDLLHLYYTRFLLSLSKIPHFLSQFYIVTLFTSLTFVKNIQIRTSIFTSIIFDLEFWSILNEDHLLNFLNNVNSKLSEPDFLLYDLVFTKQNFMNSIALISYNQKFLDPFLIFWSNVGNNIISIQQSEKKPISNLFFEICELITMPNLDKLDGNINFQNTDLSKLFEPKNFKLTHLQIELYKMIINFESNIKQNLFTNDQILYLCFLLPKKMAAPLFLERLCIRNANINYLKEKLPILTQVVHRFAFEKSIWNAIIAIIYGLDTSSSHELFDFTQESIPNNIVNPQFFSVLIEMLISLIEKVNKTNDEIELKQKNRFQSQAMDIINQILPNIIFQLIDDYNLLSFIHLISSKEKLNIISAFAEKKFSFNIDSCYKLQNLDRSILISKFNDNNSKFKELVYIFLNQPTMNDNNNFCTNVVSKLLIIYVDRGNIKMLKKLLSFLIEFSNDNIFSKTLEQFFVFYNDKTIDTSFIQAIASCLSNVIFINEQLKAKEKIENARINNNDIRNEMKIPIKFTQKLLDEVANFCNSKERFAIFSYFFVFSFEYLTDPYNYVQKFSEFQNILFEQFPNLALLFIFLAIKFNLEDKNSILNNLFLKLKEFSETPLLNNEIPFCQLIISCNDYSMLHDHISTDVIEQFNSNFEDEKKNKYFSSFEFLNIDNTSSNIILHNYTNALNFMTQHISDSIIEYFVESREFCMGLNMLLRSKEKLFSVFNSSATVYKSQMNKLPIRSYYVSSFAEPVSCPVVCMPSYFTIYTPITNPSISPQTCTNNFFDEIKNNENFAECECGILNLRNLNKQLGKISNEYPPGLYRASGLFNYDPTDILNMFKLNYGDFEKYAVCNIVRHNLRIPSICFKMSNENILLLTDATYNNGQIEFLDQTQYLAESILMNTFGQYSIFCGHFIVIIQQADIILASKYVASSKDTSVLIFSATNGQFIIEFSYFNIISLSPFNVNIQDFEDKWMNNELSNAEYLEFVNFFGMRSFSDFSAYPIFPRILKNYEELHCCNSNADRSFLPTDDFKLNNQSQNNLSKDYCSNNHDTNNDHSSRARSNSFDLASTFKSNNNLLISTSKNTNDSPLFIGSTHLKKIPLHVNSNILGSNLRDLSKPIQLVSNQDVKKFSSNFSIQKYHHSENISNSIIVSSLNLRLAPFCYQQWFLNDGWDKGERNFMNINSHLGISRKTIYELPPEVFLFPEILQNKNNFVLPKGEKFDLKLPSWSNNNSYYFIEVVKHCLELACVRKNLSKWIDLNFGYKQGSEEDFNVYSPLSYFNNSPSPEKRAWMLQCGQVPKKIFDTPHPEFKEFDFIEPLKLIFQPKKIENSPIKIKNDIVVKVNNTNFEFIFGNQYSKPIEIHPSLIFKRDVNFQSDFVVVTFCISLVSVYKIINLAQANNLGLKILSNLQCDNPFFSVLHPKQFLCATICLNEVIIWCFSNGMVVHHIDLPYVKIASFDQETNSLFLCQDYKLFHYSLNGELIRLIDINPRITALGIIPCGFSVFTRYLVTGHCDGSVKVIIIELESGQFSIVSEKKILQLKVQKICGTKNSSQVDVYEVSTS